MDRKKVFFIAGAVVLVGIIGVAMLKRDPGLSVQVATVGQEAITAKVSANGKVQAVKKADISALTMGQVTRLAVKEGDVVQKGQFLMEIDPSRSQASVKGFAASAEALAQDLESAKARLAQARKDFARAEANRKEGIISQAEYDLQRTNLTTAENAYTSSQRRVDQAKANLQEASVGLRYTTITAPMDGVVTARRIEVGETAIIGVQNQPGTVLLTISDMSKVEAEMEVDEASIPTVKLGQRAEVRIDAYPNQVFEGVVTEVGGSPILKANINEAIKFKVKVQIKNPPLTIKPGLSTQADIYTDSREKAVAIPLQALVMKEVKPKPGEAKKPGPAKEEEGVFIVEGGKAKFVPVKTGLLGDLNIEVVSGLKGGETVIMGPFRVLRDLKGGEQVQPEKKKAPKKDEKDKG